MSVNGKFQDITRDDLLEDADRFSVWKRREILAEVRSALENWAEFAFRSGLEATLRDRVALDFHLI
jgi:serine/threonine-protein kinase HipA